MNLLQLILAYQYHQSNNLIKIHSCKSLPEQIYLQIPRTITIKNHYLGSSNHTITILANNTSIYPRTLFNILDSWGNFYNKNNHHLYIDMKINILILAILLLQVHAGIYDSYYPDALKIAKAMNLEQKIGQTIQADFYAITSKGKTDYSEAVSLHLGSLLVGGNGAPTSSGDMADISPLVNIEDKLKAVYLNATESSWKALSNKFSTPNVNITTSDKKTYRIKLLLATDAVHNDQHTTGRVLFPHNIGLSCSHNPDNFYNMGYWTQTNLKRVGFNYAFAPTVAVSHNPQWGRYYQSMGQEPDYIEKYAQNFVSGLQSVSGNKISGVLGSVKHFLGDGATYLGANEGDARVYNFDTFVKRNTRGYVGAISSNIGTVMASYSGVNDVRNSMNSYYLQSLLRQDLGFNGFVISDYDEITRIPNQKYPTGFINMTEDEGVATIFNAGIDMVMLSNPIALIHRYIKHLKNHVNKNRVYMERLQDAVAKILSVKMAMGLVETVGQQPEVVAEVIPEVVPEAPLHVTSEYNDALQAVRESLVLLKNTNNLLPIYNLKSVIEYVVFVGEKIINVGHFTHLQLFKNYDNIGMQSGGWSLRWQGFQGNDFWKGQNKQSSNASSLLDAFTSFKNSSGAQFTMLYPNYSSTTNQISINSDRNSYINTLKNLTKNMNSRNTLIVGVIGEVPYAQSAGDVNIPYCQTHTDNDTRQVGCLYSSSLNPYITVSQLRTLEVNYTDFDNNVINTVRSIDKNIPVVSVVLSGRPLLINQVLNTSNAVISAWLPGTAGGQGIFDSIYGNYLFKPNGTNKNTLSVDWPADMQSIQNYPVYLPDGEVPEISSPLFKVGHGLATTLDSPILLDE